MAITTLNDVLAGARPPAMAIKNGIAMAALGASRGYTPWYATGNPGASPVTAIGVNGEAVTPALASAGGRIPRANPGGSDLAYLSRLSMMTNVSGTLWLIDRLWQNSGLSTTLTTLQSITSAALPARDSNGATDGVGVMAALECSSTMGAGVPTVTLTYRDQDNNADTTSTLTAVTGAPIGTFELFGLAAGDSGIRSVSGIQLSATRTSGAYHLVLFRLIAAMEVNGGLGGAIDALTGNLPRVFNDTVYQLLWHPSSAAAINFTGSLAETHG